MTQPSYRVLGDEELNDDALKAVLSTMPRWDRLRYCSGFDFESKVIAISEGGVVVGNDEGKVEFARLYENITDAYNQGRTLIIRTKDQNNHRFQMGKEEVVSQLVGLINGRIRGGSNADNTRSGGNETNGTDMGQGVSIGERVKFWEEQDKINQELIPRVIRQNELLTAHIADHENLPLVAGNAISEALAEAREEQQRHYDAALEAAKQEQQQQYDTALDAARQEQQQQYDAALEAAKQEQQQLHDAALEAAKTAINDEAQANFDRAVTILNEEWRKTRNILIGITAASGAIAIAAIIVGILI